MLKWWNVKIELAFNPPRFERIIILNLFKDGPFLLATFQRGIPNIYQTI